MLEAQFAEMQETQPELLAYHYTEAGLIEQAIPCWQKAGETSHCAIESLHHCAEEMDCGYEHC
jgi:hypothetical protein